MQTYTGKNLDFRNPQVEDIDIRDIAKGLSQVCRFSGQSKDFYSVAEHSIRCSYMISGNIHDEFQALLHDATEAYMGDMPSPLKVLCKDYKRIECHLWFVIAEKFEVNPILSSKVKEVDYRMLSTERDQVFNVRIPWGDMDTVKPYDLHLSFDCPTLAEEFFLNRFTDLYERYQQILELQRAGESHEKRKKIGR